MVTRDREGGENSWREMMGEDLEKTMVGDGDHLRQNIVADLTNLPVLPKKWAQFF